MQVLLLLLRCCCCCCRCCSAEQLDACFASRFKKIEPLTLSAAPREAPVAPCTCSHTLLFLHS